MFAMVIYKVLLSIILLFHFHKVNRKMLMIFFIPQFNCNIVVLLDIYLNHFPLLYLIQNTGYTQLIKICIKAINEF